jgi:heme/copper-type cytochrome/quinol oxidase subunit 2
VNDSRFKAEREGIYYGQCAKLCGKDHSAMPITIRVVGEDMPRRYIDYPEAGAGQAAGHGAGRVYRLHRAFDGA